MLALLNTLTVAITMEDAIAPRWNFADSNHDGVLCTRRPGAGQPKLWHELGGGAVELGLGVAVEGDFKVRFHHRDGDFYCWLHTAFLRGDRCELCANELDHYDRRLLKDDTLTVEFLLMDP